MCQYAYIMTVHIIRGKSDLKYQILHLCIDGCEMSSDERMIYLSESCGMLLYIITELQHEILIVYKHGYL